MSPSLLLAALTLTADPAGGLKVPDGFTVSQFAGPELANDIYCLHVDAKGRVVVAGRGYVRQLVDDDADDKADRAVELIPAPADGPMGLLWEGESLFVTSDGGVKKWTGVTGKGLPKEKPSTVIKLKTGGEHDAHAVRRGVDGKLYVLCGNMAGVTAKTATAKTSPITEPVAGCLLRLNDDGTEVEVLADGFRNPYDFDLDVNGVPFTYDSDNERCVGLPWYEPTRFYRVLAGGHYGWLSPHHAQTWRMPPYNPNVVPPVVTAGRGSPTGVACYRHTRFPDEYRRGFFFADWTFGKVWFTQPGDAKPKATPFVEVSGENGFAPTGLAVDPTSGDLFVSIGGRGTRGAVYRIRYMKGEKGEQIPLDPKPLPKWDKPKAVPLKAEALTDAKTDREKLAVVSGWFEALGGIGHPKVKGTVWEGYSFRATPDEVVLAPLVAAARDAYPAADPDLTRELGRFLAAATDDDKASRKQVLAHLKKQTDPAELVHDLFVFARLQGPRLPEQTTQVADTLLTLDEMYRKAAVSRDSNWQPRLDEVMEKLCQRDKLLAQTLTENRAFGAAEHLWLVKWTRLTKGHAGYLFAARAAKEKDFAWQAGHAECIAKLDDADARPLLDRMTDAGFADAVTLQLAVRPDERDGKRFVRGLSSPSVDVVKACAEALLKFRIYEDDEVVELVRALRRFPDEVRDEAVRAVLLKLLTRRTGQDFTTAAKWETWLAEKHPELAKKLGGTGYDAAAWKKRIEGVAWDKGDATKGKVVFAKAQCAACHTGTTGVGPSLVGVAKRFNRDDLLTAVLDPSRDVPDRYRIVRFATADQVYEGIVIYEATDGVMLQTSADKTVRIPGRAIESRKPGTQSLMPTGLLDALSDAEVADLFAYLKKLE